MITIQLDVHITDHAGRTIARFVSDWSGCIDDIETWGAGVWWGANAVGASVHTVTLTGVSDDGQRVGVELARGTWGGPDIVYV